MLLQTPYLLKMGMVWQDPDSYAAVVLLLLTACILYRG
jgi:hypothetical protein